MNIELLVVVVAAGAVTGILAGLLGIGGGFVFVPTLLWLFGAHGYAEETAMQFAVGTSLAAIVPTSLVSWRAHARHGNVDGAAVRRLMPGLVAGAVAGAWLASVVAGPTLERVFAAFLVMVAVQLALERAPAPHRDLPGPAGAVAAGGAIGALSSLVGIGGGSLTAPYLVWCNRPMLRAVGSAAAAGLPIAAVGALTFVATGLLAGEHTVYKAGYVVWPAALGLGTLAMVTAPVGARLATRLATRWLRRVFAASLVLVAARLLAG